MPHIPDLQWTAGDPGPSAGVVVLTRLHLRRLRDVPPFLRTSLAIRRQVMRSPGARSLALRAEPLARRFTTVSWWDDEAAVHAFARTDPHRSGMRQWRNHLTSFDNITMPGTARVVPTVVAATREAAAPRARP